MALDIAEPLLLEPKALGWGRRAIQKIASDTASHLNFRPGDDIRALVDSLGGKVLDTDFDSARHTGSIEVLSKNEFIIYLSPHSGVRRSRFTIAHELGHYFLHSKAGELTISVKRDGSGLVEWEANWFAAGFLMPESEFLGKKAEGYERAGLAEFFQVSQAAVEIRLEGLP